MIEWRKAVRTPISYTINTNSIRMQKTFATVIPICGALTLFVVYAFVPQADVRMLRSYNKDPDHTHPPPRPDCVMPAAAAPPMGRSFPDYNFTYPLTNPTRSGSETTFRVAVISDLDTNSKAAKKDQWVSYLLKGYLRYDSSAETVKIYWDRRKTSLTSRTSTGGRGMELSELVVFNGKLYTCDDRTGIIYQIVGNRTVPWVILSDGDGQSTDKGFKCEWLAVKDSTMYVGGLGKEWTDSQGNLINYDPQWVKTISPSGEVTNVNWRQQYVALRSAAGIQYPGYVIHEATAWSPIHSRWFFIPRRASSEAYNELTDEHKGTNLLLTSNSAFTNVKMQTIGPVIPTHGYSSFKFIPGTGDQIVVAIKSEEDDGRVASYATAFNVMTGRILMAETKIADGLKYEGFEFI